MVARALTLRQSGLMFTGIVEETGKVERIVPSEKSIQLFVRMTRCGRGLKLGDSLAVNGCCLTITELRGSARSRIARFDLLRETWDRTNLQFAQPGAAVNLERALAASDRLGGHFVTGHIDGLGTILRWERSGADHLLDIAPPPELMRYIVSKGSIAVDGISLTIAEVHRKSFRIWIIPHTYAVTALREREVGSRINLEADILGKYVEKFIAARKSR
jgi:riboflavin synthase